MTDEIEQPEVVFTVEAQALVEQLHAAAMQHCERIAPTCSPYGYGYATVHEKQLGGVENVQLSIDELGLHGHRVLVSAGEPGDRFVSLTNPDGVTTLRASLR